VANVSLQHITGESQPVRLAPGGEVPAGSLSTDGLLVVRVAATSQDSTPARIVRMAADAQVGAHAGGMELREGGALAICAGAAPCGCCVRPERAGALPYVVAAP
jgi:hypothetical protein